MSDDDRPYIMYAYSDMGWSRFFPIAAVEVVGGIALHGRMTRDEIGRWVARGYDDHTDGLLLPVWEKTDPWTEESLREHYEEFPPQPGQRQTVEEANAEDRANHDARVTAIDSYATSLGLRPPRTIADLLEYMQACGFLRTDGAGEDLVYEMNPEVRLPTETLRLDETTRRREDEIRWRMLVEPIAQKMIGLFHPDDEERLDVKRTSLQRLARELDVDVETARAGLSGLLQSPDFTTTADPERVLEHQVFEIHVNWEIFADTRIGIRLALPPGETEQE